VAGHLEHLVLSVKPLHLAFSLPSFILKFMFGKPRHQSKNFNELKEAYHRRLEAGGKASKPYIPSREKASGSKSQLIENFNNAHDKLKVKLDSWSEAQLDACVLPHPLLGKITLREMICFTIFHIEHHQKAIKN